LLQAVAGLDFCAPPPVGNFGHDQGDDNHSNDQKCYRSNIGIAKTLK